MRNYRRAWHALVLEHVLDQINAPTRTIEFVAEEEIGRAGRSAEPAMDARPEDTLRLAHGRLGQRCYREIRLHGGLSQS